ncbi:hypothetical protein [Clostridium perfringens]|uniref:hypothetical protein n=1 Tax=Clostridium perfringens TaxID=1502 RepID=UPI0013E2FE45|nr:hypothetical protein [Clostridium perfringens]EGS5727834.1 hypothetical protein [Clostridium perfringens]EHK2278732.1 hypothetical protein [Clostridium perfringens]ELC8403667.1 hypothetical protein [Clostridium perfringens]ELC8461766.1 hypothetical protein [Clostridium perfringens]MBI6052892.1 hypothetical protein [Clostridium perfringens]
MELLVYVKGRRGPFTYSGDRIDVLDFEMNGIEYKQIRYFRKGFSKSELIESELITRMRENK